VFILELCERMLIKWKMQRSVYTRHGLLQKDGLPMSPEQAMKHLEAKYVVLYFSASWCGPCRSYTPKLVELYQREERPSNVEFIFVSLDRELKSFETYYSKMPWKAFPYSSSVRQELPQALGIRVIPAAVVLSPHDEIITTEGRSSLSLDYLYNLCTQ